MTFKSFCGKIGEGIKKTGKFCCDSVQSILTFIIENPKELFYLILIILLCLFLMRSCNEKKAMEEMYVENIEVLHDSLNTYKSKNGNLVCERDMLVGDIELLKITNEELYNDLVDLKRKNADLVVKLNATVKNETHDTVYIIKPTSLYITKQFDFSNKWRTLAGDINLANDSLSLNINKDEVYVDFTIAMEDNNVRIKSNNPYIEYDNVYGIIQPEYTDNWSLNIGPSINVGYDPIHKTFSPTVGVSLTFGYNIWSFGKRLKRK